MNDLAENKAFFMSFWRHPSKLTLGYSVLNELREVKRSQESKEILHMLMESLNKNKRTQRPPLAVVWASENVVLLNLHANET